MKPDEHPDLGTVPEPSAALREGARSVRTPAYVYDLAGLRAHAAAVRAAVPVELYYAVKANPDARVLAALAPYVDGVEVSSGGELAHVRRALPDARIAFGGPGKSAQELAAATGLPVDSARAAVAGPGGGPRDEPRTDPHEETGTRPRGDAGTGPDGETGGRSPGGPGAAVHRIHVESPRELARLAALRREADVLLRMNMPVAAGGAALRMDGPFGMDPAALGACLELLGRTPWLRLRGMHAHLASGLAAGPLLEVAARVLGWARSWMDGPLEMNLGGGMAVDYRRPGERFDWAAYGRGLASLRRPGERLRIEPGRALTAYCGWYVTDVLDLKRTRGAWYAVLDGGTHHLRTPVTKGHDQPFVVLPAERDEEGGPDDVASGPVTLAGRLCTPKDVFARRVAVERLAVGDRVAFALAGAYAWNISHHDFLMHPKPAFAYVDDATAEPPPGGPAEPAPPRPVTGR